MSDAMLTLQDLEIHFPTKGGIVRAVDGISLSVKQGNILGLVGESGSAKSTVGRAALRLVNPTGGKVRIDRVDITTAKSRDLKDMRTKA